MSVAEAGTVYKASVEFRGSEEMRYRKEAAPSPKKTSRCRNFGQAWFFCVCLHFPLPGSSKSREGVSTSACSSETSDNVTFVASL